MEKILHVEKLSDVQQIVASTEATEFILNSENTSNDRRGVSCSIKFESLKTCENPSGIMLSNNNGFIALTGIEDVSFENHVLGMLMKVVMKTGICMTVICR